MRVLVTGATGFIGRALVAALQRTGHHVVRASRHAPPGRRDASAQDEHLAVDFAKVPGAAWWQPQLAGVDAVVNAVGILREQPGQSFEALHHRAPAALFEACVQAGVATVVQVSALGADGEARSRYHRTKKAADDVLRGLPLRAAIVQPSVVYGTGGASATMFNGMAALPVLALPRGGDMQVQPVHVQDVIAGVLKLLETPPEGRPTIAFVGPEPMTFRDFLARLRVGLAVGGRLRVVPIPESLFRLAAGVAGHIPGSALDPETAGMLLRGNVAPAAPFAQLLGRSPRPVADFIVDGERQDV